VEGEGGEGKLEVGGVPWWSWLVEEESAEAGGWGSRSQAGERDERPGASAHGAWPSCAADDTVSDCYDDGLKCGG
jgi:hypothetical protein